MLMWCYGADASVGAKALLDGIDPNAGSGVLWDGVDADAGANAGAELVLVPTQC